MTQNPIIMKFQPINEYFETIGTLFFMALVFSACKEEPILEPVESILKVAPHQEPTFTDQTRVAGMKTKSNYKVTILTENLDLPWGIDQIPDGRFIISEKNR